VFELHPRREVAVAKAKSKRALTREEPTKARTPRVRQSVQKAAAAQTLLTAGRARSILYVHGIGNKPRAEVLKCQWDQALFGFGLGERSRLAYWVNRVTYPDPWPATCAEEDRTTVGETQPASIRTRGVAVGLATGGLESLVEDLPDLSKEQRAVLERLARQIERNASPGNETIRAAAAVGAQALPLPAPLRNWITRRITNLYLLDVHEYFFAAERRKVMLDSVRDRLLSGRGPFVVIGHSQGSMIAYHALFELASEHPELEIDLFLTIGSPLGLTEVQDQIKRLTKQSGGLAVPANVRRWVNVSDPLDPVCADKDLADDIAETAGVGVVDVLAWNKESPRDPHSGSGYLQMDEVREAVQAHVQRDLFQRVTSFTVARDLVQEMESRLPQDRHTVLIELSDPRLAQAAPTSAQPTSLADARQEVVRWIDRHVKKANPKLADDDLELEQLNNYVSARLTRFEIERLANDLEQATVHRIYRNAEKKALLRESCRVVQATTAHRGYEADGRGIVWAVLDTGIDIAHPHFATNKSIQDVFDCLAAGQVRQRAADAGPADRRGLDRNGHGSHVSGIIAGAFTPADPQELPLVGLAPFCKLVSYKVLSDSGAGSDAKIIKALDHIFDLNQRSTSLAIHGVNLSLGGAFDPQAFGCGDSPLCKRLRELWRQGVVVVLAAGNEGYLEIASGNQQLALNMDLSIGDPANLDESIAVGSVHKQRPHHYGVSYFSSRGPTADGRAKPDVVAPGERVLSCRAGATGLITNDLYVELSGTSMAAPVVSGVLASFLSARREFIGFPDRTKEHLLANCTDLRRDRMHQGAGLPNLVKMLLNT